MTPDPELGEIITFYSYKGGTGRSMAMANVACLLAQHQVQKAGKGVLVVDWDLEAPGLHRFFRERLRRRFGSSSDYDRAINEHPGLIDLFRILQGALAKQTVPREEPDEQTEATLINAMPLQDYLLETDIEGLHFLKAGNFEDEYSRRVNTFDWDALHQQAPWLFSWFVNRLAQRYTYVLIDSRTGITDTSGICTMILPEKLVVVFTPNRQSTEGALNLTRQAVGYRSRSDDLRPLRVYPLPSRIEGTMEDLRSFWRSDRTVGYQPQFESLFQEIYKLPHCDLAAYFDAIFIQQAPDYAFGEEIAVLRGKSQDRVSITGSYAQFADWLAGANFPWETQEQVQAQSLAETLVRSAIAAFARFSPDEQAIARRVLTRLVALGEVGQGTRLTLKIAEFQPAEVRIVHALVEARVLQLQQHGKEDVVELALDALIQQWPHLRQWLDEDREFLLWRQALDIQRASWDLKGRGADLLLRGTALAEAGQRMQARPADLSPTEREYIEESYKAERAAQAAEEERLKREQDQRIQAERAKQAAEEERLKREQERIQLERASQLAAEVLLRREVEMRARHRRRTILAVASVIALLALASAWIAWIYSGTYQIGKILKDAPVSNAASATNGDVAVIAWAQALALSGRTDNALAAARQINNLTTRVYRMVPVAQVLGRVGMDDASTRFCNDALAAARQIDDPDQRANALAAVAKTFALTGKVDDALVAARQIDDPYQRATALAAIATALAQAGKPDDAQKALDDAQKALIDAVAAAHQIADPFQRAMALASAGRLFLQAGKPQDARKTLNDALAVARQIVDPNRRIAVVWNSVFVSFAEAGMVDDTLAAARQIDDPSRRALALAYAGGLFAQAGKAQDARKTLNDALTAAHQIADPGTPAYALAAIAKSLAQAGRVNDALAAAGQIADTNQQAAATAAVAESLAQAGKVDDALAAARQIGDPYRRATALAAVAPLLARAGKPDDAQKALADALTPAHQIDDPRLRAAALTTVGQSLAQAGNPDDAQKALTDAFDAARQIKDPSVREKEFTGVAKLMIQAGKVSDAKQIISQALEFAQQIPNDTQRLSALADVARVEALLHSYRRARLLVEPCLSEDKLSAYAAILTEYTKQRNPALGKALDALEKLPKSNDGT